MKNLIAIVLITVISSGCAYMDDVFNGYTPPQPNFTQEEQRLVNKAKIATDPKWSGESMEDYQKRIGLSAHGQAMKDLRGIIWDIKNDSGAYSTR